MAIPGIRSIESQITNPRIAKTPVSQIRMQANSGIAESDQVVFERQNAKKSIKPKSILATLRQFLSNLWHAIVMKLKGQRLSKPLHHFPEFQPSQTQQLKIEAYQQLSSREKQRLLVHYLTRLEASKSHQQTQELIDSLTALAHSGLNLNKRLPSGSTPLIEVASVGNTDVVKAFIQAGADVNQYSKSRILPWPFNAEKFTPIMKATFYGHLDIVKLLIQAGADINKPCVASGKSRFESGDTPLLCAAKEGYANIVETLMAAGAKTDVINFMNETPLSVSGSSHYYFPPIKNKMPKNDPERISQILQTPHAKGSKL
jgi:hypothetical protein